MTGLLLNQSEAVINGWWLAFAACAVQSIAGAFVFMLCAKGDRIFGNDTDS